MPANTTGSWDPLKPWPFVAIHAVVLPDGKVLTYGSDGTADPYNRIPKNAIMKHDVYDPATGTHQTIDHTHSTTTDIFCSSAILIPGTDQVMIVGGDTRPTGVTNAGVDDTNIFDASTGHLNKSPEGDMNYARWYATTISLPTGQIVTMGGIDQKGALVTTPEIWTAGEGWRALTGATTADIDYYYPRMWTGKDGKIVYVSAGPGNNGAYEVMQLNPNGGGSITKLAQLPFAHDGNSPAIMYESGKVLFMDTTGQLWTMNLNSGTPVFVKGAKLSQNRDDANMTVMADGKVLITGGTASGNKEALADKTATVWDPATGQVTYMVDEAQPRLYHSTAVLLQDGSILSMGGGFAGMAEKDYFDSQIYKPKYLFDANGNPATRPVITKGADTLEPGQSFTITVDNAAAISKMTFVKTGATTHAFNMDANFINLTFTKGANNTITVTLPQGVDKVPAGAWMLFAWNDKGVPSIADMVSVQPTLTPFEINGRGGEFIDPSASDAGPDLIDNGSFEKGVADWTFTGTGAVDGTAARAAGGKGYFAMDGWGNAHNGLLSQTIDTVAGETYTMRFMAKVSLFGATSANAQIKMEALNGATAVGVKTVAISGTMAEYTMTFTATGSKTTVKLSDVSPKGQGDFDIDIDTISVRDTDGQTTTRQGPELVVNGGFEAGGPGVGTGWTFTGTGGREATVASRSAEGTSYLAMDGWGNAHNGVLSQTIDTVAGQVYTMKFMAKTSLFGATAANAQLKMEALNGATAVGTQIVKVNGLMSEYTMTFTATASKTTIKLSDVSPKGQLDFDIDIDLVSVRAQGVGPVDPNPPTNQNLLSNGSFETVPGAHAGMPMEIVATNGQVGPWQSSTNRIEVWTEGKNGVTGTDGKNVVEVSAQTGTLSQTIKTEAGKYYGISFDYAGAPGAIASSKMEVLFNGVVIGTVTPADAAMKNYHFHVHGTGGNDVLAFRAVAGDTDGLGGLLDKVELYVSGHGENPPTTTDLNFSTESAGKVVDLKAGTWTDATRILLLGDSLTEGATTPGGYRAPLYDKLVRDHGVLVDFVGGRTTNAIAGQGDVNHQGTGGTTAQIVAGQMAGIISANPHDKALVMLGTNDATTAATPQAIVASLFSIIRSIEAGNPNVEIFLATLPIAGDARQAKIAAVNQLLPALVQQAKAEGIDVKLVDFSSMKLTDMYDGVHPTAAGQQKWADIWLNSLVANSTKDGGTLDGTVKSAGNAQNVIGSSGNDRLLGNDGSNVLNGGAGNDYLDGRGGSNTISGGAGIDVFAFNAADKGTHVVTDFVAGDTIQLINFGFANAAAAGVAFRQAGTDVLFESQGTTFTVKNATLSTVLAAVRPPYQAAGNPPTNPPAGNNTITGTAGDDWLADTDANDIMKGGDGKDTFFLKGKGDDFVDGEGGSYNQVDLKGVAADYTFTRNADGTVTVKSAAYGTDTLKNIGGIYFYGDAKWYSLATLAPVTGNPPTNPPAGNNTITGTAGDDWLADTDANDVMKGGDGKDTFFLKGKGDDFVDGEGGSYNQVDLKGVAADYTFTRNADGTVTVKSAAYGTDTLKNIGGIYFYGDAKWYSLATLAPVTGTPPTNPPTNPPVGNNTITGTAGDDRLSDTDANDVMKGGDGRDTFLLFSKGNDYVDGEGGDYNQVDLKGSAADYAFSRNADGTVTVTSTAYGTDTLKNIGGIYFYGEAKWYSLATLAPAAATLTAAAPHSHGDGQHDATGAVVGTDGDNILLGTDANETFKGLAGNDRFNGGKGNDVYEGGAGNDTVELNGKMSDWAFARNADGSYSATHAVYGQDILKDIEHIAFVDQGMTHTPNELA